MRIEEYFRSMTPETGCVPEVVVPRRGSSNDDERNDSNACGGDCCGASNTESTQFRRPSGTTTETVDNASPHSVAAASPGESSQLPHKSGFRMTYPLTTPACWSGLWDNCRVEAETQAVGEVTRYSMPTPTQVTYITACVSLTPRLTLAACVVRS